MKITILTSNDQVLHELGARIRAVRIDMPLTQVQLAERAGVSLSTVAKLERGEDVRLTSLLGILRVLGMLGAVDALVPEATVRPSDIATLGKPRQRARMPKEAKPTSWTWGDDR